MALRYFQVHKDGKNVSGEATYPSLEQAALALRDAPAGSEEVEIDGANEVIRRYTREECATAANAFLHPQVRK
jgi:hypothetical protein